MGALYDARTKIEAIIQQRQLDRAATCGKIGLKAGLLIALVRQDTPDDAAKLQLLKNATREVLGVSI